MKQIIALLLIIGVLLSGWLFLQGNENTRESSNTEDVELIAYVNVQNFHHNKVFKSNTLINDFDLFKAHKNNLQLQCYFSKCKYGLSILLRVLLI
ncbi:MAG: hypothetical protein EAZ07_02725 [Cytophagales bacterium]|nr:MAG: hypothetical protein EAZ07_02725 [Cytophagales bacterium]